MAIRKKYRKVPVKKRKKRSANKKSKLCGKKKSKKRSVREEEVQSEMNTNSERHMNGNQPAFFAPAMFGNLFAFYNGRPGESGISYGDEASDESMDDESSERFKGFAIALSMVDILLVSGAIGLFFIKPNCGGKTNKEPVADVGVPNVPGVPAIPAGHGVPGLPGVPAIPAGHGVPAVHAIPAGHGLPGLPSVSAIPSVPALPPSPALPVFAVPASPALTLTTTLSEEFIRIPEEYYELNDPMFQCGEPSAAEEEWMSEEKTWPWFLSFVMKDPKKNVLIHRCGATLVSPRHALTAMTCLGEMTEEEIIADTGVIVGKRPEKSTGYLVRFIKVRHHPLGLPQEPIQYDMTLLTLETEIEMGSEVKPVCLPLARKIALDQNYQAYCYALGWMKTDAIKVIPTEYLYQFQCDDMFEKEAASPETAFCAKELNGVFLQRNLCLLDIGGPMLCKEEEYWILYGIITKERLCKLDYVLFSQISYSVNWLCCFMPDTMSCLDTPCDFSLVENPP